MTPNKTILSTFVLSSYIDVVPSVYGSDWTGFYSGESRSMSWFLFFIFPILLAHMPVDFSSNFHIFFSTLRKFMIPVPFPSSPVPVFCILLLAQILVYTFSIPCCRLTCNSQLLVGRLSSYQIPRFLLSGLHYRVLPGFHIRRLCRGSSYADHLHLFRYFTGFSQIMTPWNI